MWSWPHGRGFRTQNCWCDAAASSCCCQPSTAIMKETPTAGNSGQTIGTSSEVFFFFPILSHDSVVGCDELRSRIVLVGCEEILVESPKILTQLEVVTGRRSFKVLTTVRATSKDGSGSTMRSLMEGTKSQGCSQLLDMVGLTGLCTGLPLCGKWWYLQKAGVKTNIHCKCWLEILLSL